MGLLLSVPVDRVIIIVCDGIIITRGEVIIVARLIFVEDRVRSTIVIIIVVGRIIGKVTIISSIVLSSAICQYCGCYSYYLWR